jgi:hypothetical protein
MAPARLILAAAAACAFLAGCGSPCGLRLQEHLFLPAATRAGGQQRNIELACCGGSVFRDIDLTSTGDLEVDLTNPNGSGVDGFLTTAGCDRLFNAPYSGAAAGALCQVHIGPVGPRAVSGRKKLARGRYRMFAQGYAANDAPLMVSLDLGVWSSACQWNPIGP